MRSGGGEVAEDTVGGGIGNLGIKFGTILCQMCLNLGRPEQ